MRLIPVIDLLGGQAVHAVKGERERYQPVRSVLCSTPDPFEVARAFRDRLGLNEIYIADLDSIRSFGQTNHREVIAALAAREGINIILDAGVSHVEGIRAWLDLGVHRVVIGSETLCAWDALRDFPSRSGGSRLAFSLDFRAGKILSRCPALAAIPPMEALEHLRFSGWQEIILLELRRVGSGEGIDCELAAEACASFPDLNLLVGGGMADPEELIKLQSLGINGVLMATAFHRGIIGARHLSALRGNRS
jgi:phosphoribosylformimino-5-aminoimidazole carboxamide ribotide isomerase